LHTRQTLVTKQAAQLAGQSAHLPEPITLEEPHDRQFVSAAPLQDLQEA
jgi:hypothetical protein